MNFALRDTSRAFPSLFSTADLSEPRVHTVPIGYYMKHLMLYRDGRFAGHALQAGRICVCQHPQDAQLSVEELREMVGQAGTAFSNHVIHFL